MKSLGAALALTLAGGCSPGDGKAWQGYYYDDVLSSAPAQVSGPYDSAPQCVAAMHTRLRQAPSLASFACARQCRSGGDGLVDSCREVAR